MLAIKAPPEEGGTCRRAGARKGGRHQTGAGGRGPSWDLSPFTNSGSSPDRGRVLRKVAIPHGARLSVQERCGAAGPGAATQQARP